MIAAVTRFVLVTAFRDRLPAGLALFCGLMVFLAVTVGDTAFLEKVEITAVYAAGVVRFGLVFGLSIFIALSVQRLFEYREIEVLLSRAMSRDALVIGFWLALAFLCLLLLTPFAIAIWYLAPSKSGALAWSLSVGAELLIISAFVLFAAFTIERALPTLFTLAAFYALARLSGFFLGLTGRLTVDVGVEATDIMTAVSVIVPRLDMFGQTRWLVYGLTPNDGFTLMAIQTLVFVPLLLAAACIDLQRKRL